MKELRDLAKRYDLPERSKLRKKTSSKSYPGFKRSYDYRKIKENTKKITNINSENELLKNQTHQLLNAEVDSQLTANAYDKKLQKSLI